jgi:1,4-dihydroxy-2-naphthoate octaprenyltransferase
VLALLPLVMLPTAIQQVRRAFETEEPAKLNRVLRATARLHGRFGWLMIFGFIGAMVGRLV